MIRHQFERFVRPDGYHRLTSRNRGYGARQFKWRRLSPCASAAGLTVLPGESDSDLEKSRVTAMLAEQNWIWLLVALAIGVWVGWMSCAAKRNKPS